MVAKLDRITSCVSKSDLAGFLFFRHVCRFERS